MCLGSGKVKYNVSILTINKRFGNTWSRVDLSTSQAVQYTNKNKISIKFTSNGIRMKWLCKPDYITSTHCNIHINILLGVNLY